MCEVRSGGEVSCDKGGTNPVTAVIGSAVTDWGGKKPVTAVVGTDVTEEERILSQLWWGQK